MESGFLLPLICAVNEIIKKGIFFLSVQPRANVESHYRVITAKVKTALPRFFLHCLQ